ncbi:hypothetical protein XH9_17005 [Glutamicibacter mysorens]|nr:hypothetical protein [Glutamicibacter mysorens]UTM48955.1 hypothetical protein XH9_17005 [Glutamicibacter mysorens]
MIAPVNPCGFALLPAWITHALGDAASSPAPVRLLRSLRAGLAVTIGFAGTLALAGIAVSAGARSLIQAAPALGLAVGVVLVLFGAAMLAGRSFSLRLPGIPSRVTARPPSTARMVVFGVGYAAASPSPLPLPVRRSRDALPHWHAMAPGSPPPCSSSPGPTWPSTGTRPSPMTLQRSAAPMPSPRSQLRCLTGSRGTSAS